MNHDYNHWRSVVHNQPRTGWMFKFPLERMSILTLVRHSVQQTCSKIFSCWESNGTALLLEMTVAHRSTCDQCCAPSASCSTTLRATSCASRNESLERLEGSWLCSHPPSSTLQLRSDDFPFPTAPGSPKCVNSPLAPAEGPFNTKDESLVYQPRLNMISN